jgi:hypothetical protein
MTKAEKKRHKFFNLLRFGYRQGWVIPLQGTIVIAGCSPQHFHDRLKKFESLFKGEIVTT